MIIANVKRNPNLNPNPKGPNPILNPYPPPNQNPNHYQSLL